MGDRNEPESKQMTVSISTEQATADVRERIERARSEPMSHTVTGSETTVVVVDNEASGRTHTLVPGELHCSCEDFTYRNVPCKHLLYVVLETDVSEGRQAITDRLHELQDDELELKAELRGILVERAEWEVIRGEIDVSDPDTDGDVDEDPDMGPLALDPIRELAQEITESMDT